MVASIDNPERLHNGGERGSTKPRKLETEDAAAIAASMKNDPFQYYAARDAGMNMSGSKPPVNPNDPFSYYYDRGYEAEQQQAAQRAAEEAARLEAKRAEKAKPSFSDATMSMSVGSTASAASTAASTAVAARSAGTATEEHPLERWGRQERETRERANRQVQKGVADLKNEEEKELDRGTNRLWLTTGIVTLLALLAGGAYFIAPKLLADRAEQDAERDARDAETPAAVADPTGAAGADREERASTADDADDRAGGADTADRGDRADDELDALNGDDSLDSDRETPRGQRLGAADLGLDEDDVEIFDEEDGESDGLDDRREMRGLDADEALDARGRRGRRGSQTVDREDIVAPLGLNGGNFASWWQGEPVDGSGGGRTRRDRDEDGETDFEATADDELDADESDSGGLLFDDGGDDGEARVGSGSGSRVSSSFDSGSGDDDFSVPAPGSGLLFGGSSSGGSSGGRVPASMTEQTVQLSISGITNAIPRGIDAPVRDEQRVGSYRVTDTYLPCQSSDASDCRDVHPVYGYHSVPHMGVDLAMPHGAPIFAVGKQGSTVNVLCYTTGGGGLVAEMSSTSMPEYEFKAMHLSDCIEGSFDVGTIVAAVGSSGGATGPHLHWEAFYNGAQVDPPRWSIEYAIKGNIIRDDAAKFSY